MATFSVTPNPKPGEIAALNMPTESVGIIVDHTEKKPGFDYTGGLLLRNGNDYIAVGSPGLDGFHADLKVVPFVVRVLAPGEWVLLKMVTA